MPASVPIALSDQERAHLQTCVQRGRANARALTRAHILLKLDASWRDEQIREAFTVGASTMGPAPSGASASARRPAAWGRCCATTSRSDGARR